VEVPLWISRAGRGPNRSVVPAPHLSCHPRGMPRRPAVIGVAVLALVGLGVIGVTMSRDGIGPFDYPKRTVSIRAVWVSDTDPSLLTVAGWRGCDGLVDATAQVSTRRVVIRMRMQPLKGACARTLSLAPALVHLHESLGGRVIQDERTGRFSPPGQRISATVPQQGKPSRASPSVWESADCP
jgi:hypothetical protein